MKLSDCPSCISSPSEYEKNDANNDDNDYDDNENDDNDDNYIIGKSGCEESSSKVFSRFYFLPSTKAWSELTKVFFRDKKTKSLNNNYSINRLNPYRKFDCLERKHKIKKRDLVRAGIKNKQQQLSPGKDYFNFCTFSATIYVI